MSKTLTIHKRTTSSSSKDANNTARAPVRGRNRNNHVAPSKPSAARADFGTRPQRDDKAPRPSRENREGGDRRDDGRDHRDDRRDDRSRAPRADFGARPTRDDRTPRPPRENREQGDKRNGRDARDSRDARGAKPNHRESLSRAPQRHGKVRDGVREVVDGHVVRGEKRPAPRKPQFPKERDHSSELKTNPAEGIRVSKYLADKGLCSRREADHYIEKGWVTVNGVRVTLGQRILPTDKVQLARQASVAQESRVTIIINKPMGFVSGQAEDGYAPAVSLVTAENQWDEAEFQQDFNFKHLRGLAPAGRLDIDSVGLLVLTQDGRVAKQLIGENSDVDKEYLVRVEGELIESGLALLNHGLELDGVPLRPAQVSWQNDEQLMFVLREGKKRQIRRMCELVGLKVVGLKRVRIGNIRLGHLPTGKWRYLSPDEQF
ncbi:MAG: rluF [Burkholderiaceae bacterium]|nr:rluF [Burkholderiaceae bacterium]